MRHALASLALLSLAAQQGPPQFGPDNPEGLVITPNGRHRLAWHRKGIWKIDPLNGPASPPDRQSVSATLDKLSTLIKATPTASALSGFWMKESRNLYPGNPHHFEIGFFPFYLEDVLTNGKFVPQWAGETESVYFQFNSLPGPLSQPVIAGGFYLRPQQTASFAGFPIFDDSNLLITRHNRDPWAPVPLRTALLAAQPEFEKDRQTAESRLASLKKQNDEIQSPAFEQKMREHLEKYSGEFRTSNPAKWKGRLEGMERELLYNRQQAAKKANPLRDKEGNWYWNPIDAHANAAKRLAALSPADAAAPACYLPAPDSDGRYALRGDLFPLSSNPACRPLATANTAYFDPALPRTAPQLLRVNAFGRCAAVSNGKLVQKHRPGYSHPPQGCFIHVPIWEQLDWAAVARLLVP
jgi:hypothetical protein